MDNEIKPAIPPQTIEDLHILWNDSQSYIAQQNIELAEQIKALDDRLDKLKDILIVIRKEQLDGNKASR